MNSAKHYRALSWICISGIAVFLLWITFAPNGFPGAPVVVCLMGGSAFAALHLRAHALSPYWQSVAEPAQAPRVAQMIVACLVVQTLFWAAKMVGGLAYLPQLASMSYSAISDVIWTATMVIFIGSRYVKWPKRLAKPPKKDFVIVATAAILVATAISLLSIMLFEGQRIETAQTRFTMSLPKLFYGSFIEESFFRILLLTALVRASRSSNHALVLSSVAFALMHVPGNFLQPVLEMDYSLFEHSVGTYIPQFVWQLGLGFAMGALWLRTGSIMLIVTTHAIFNFGSLWLTGQ